MKTAELCERYRIADRAIIRSERLHGSCSAELSGIVYPLFEWRHETRMQLMKSCITEGIVSNIRMLKAYRIDRSSCGLRELLFRELDIALFITDSRPEYIYALSSGDRTMNLVMGMEGGILYTVELAANLADDAAPIDRHELIASEGAVADLPVDTMIPQNSVNVFTASGGNAYSDNDVELYGLKPDEALAVRGAFVLSSDNDRAEYIKRSQLLSELVNAAFESADAGTKVYIGGNRE